MDQVKQALPATLLFLLFSMQAQAGLRVFTCEPEWAALAKEIGGEKIEAHSAVTGVQDVHYIQARPSLIAKVRKADLIICTGADLEVGWLPVLLRQAGNPDVQPGASGFLEAAGFVELLEVPEIVDRALGDIHPFGNPHIQLDPRNITAVANAVKDRLIALDETNAAYYGERNQNFERRWKDSIEKWTRLAAPLKGVEIVTHHESWVYLIHWLDLKEIGTLEPKPGIPPSTAHLARLLNRIEGQNVKAIIRSSYQSSRASHWLSKRTEIPNIVLPHTVGSVEGSDDLFAMFDILIERLLDVT